ncbi:MAG: hypothetical protein LBM62_06540 [Mediterranea sp.]|jgi:hypothetical protein|nr:hypothetical protein [Mediterranea sp.]
MKTFAYSLLTLLVTAGLSACAPEEYATVDEAGLPSVSNVANNFTISVNQETNTVTFEYTGADSYPIWIINNGTNTTRNTQFKFTQVFAKAGTYTAELKVGNRNGISDGSVTREFTLDNTLVDLAKVAQLCGTISKTWVWNSRVAGHFGCGEPGTDGLNWWSAPAEDKKDWGMYDDSFTFNVDGTYTYNPGDGGTVYVNTGVAAFSQYNTNDGADYMVPVDQQVSTWEMEYEGEDLYLVFPAHTLVGYLSSDEQYETPKFKIYSLSDNKIVLTSVQSGITWHYEFIPKELFESGEVVEDLDPSQYAEGIVGTWTWDSSFAGHFGCGESPDSPTNWWSAGPNEKADWGIYDDLMTFTADGNYTFNPGPDGEIYVNTGVTLFPDYNTANGQDFDAPVSEQTTTYQVVEESGAYYLVLPADTYFTYMPGDAVYHNPKFKITKMTPNSIQLSSVDTGISWRYSFKRVP